MAPLSSSGLHSGSFYTGPGVFTDFTKKGRWVGPGTSTLILPTQLQFETQDVTIEADTYRQVTVDFPLGPALLETPG